MKIATKIDTSINIYASIFIAIFIDEDAVSRLDTYAGTLPQLTSM
jgi:hypothetical protein